ncbi:MAG: hypothetical protein BEN18_00735 [Epulopiscium sp. Nuni2H_MBin001]|nr:MAG: hypothetical protein BEN18_00735 [Epulopiscium sp. Nuni2H_MBin001]
MAIKKFQKHLPVTMALVLGSSFTILATENSDLISLADIKSAEEFSISPIDEDGSSEPEYNLAYSDDEITYGLYNIEVIDTYMELITSVYISDNQGADVDGNNLWATDITINAYKSAVEPYISDIITALKRIESTNAQYANSIYVGTFDASVDGDADLNPNGHDNSDATTYADVLVDLITNIKAAYLEVYNVELDLADFYSEDENGLTTFVDTQLGTIIDTITEDSESNTLEKNEDGSLIAIVNVSDINGVEVPMNEEWVNSTTWNAYITALEAAELAYDNATKSYLREESLSERSFGTVSANVTTQLKMVSDNLESVLNSLNDNKADGTYELYQASKDLYLELELVKFVLNGAGVDDTTGPDSPTYETIITGAYGHGDDTAYTDSGALYPTNDSTDNTLKLITGYIYETDADLVGRAILDTTTAPADVANVGTVFSVADIKIPILSVHNGVDVADVYAIQSEYDALKTAYETANSAFELFSSLNDDNDDLDEDFVGTTAGLNSIKQVYNSLSTARETYTSITRQGSRSEVLDALEDFEDSIKEAYLAIYGSYHDGSTDLTDVDDMADVSVNDLKASFSYDAVLDDGDIKISDNGNTIIETGTSLANGEKYVTKATMETYLEAINAAYDAYEDKTLGKTEIESATNVLDGQTTTFNNAIQIYNADTYNLAVHELVTTITNAEARLNGGTLYTAKTDTSGLTGDPWTWAADDSGETASLHESSTKDGTDIIDENKWVTEAAMTTFKTAIEDAKAFIGYDESVANGSNAPEYTATQLTAAKATLNAAINDFDGGAKIGSQTTISVLYLIYQEAIADALEILEDAQGETTTTPLYVKDDEGEFVYVYDSTDEEYDYTTYDENEATHAGEQRYSLAYTEADSDDDEDTVYYVYIDGAYEAYDDTDDDHTDLQLYKQRFTKTTTGILSDNAGLNLLSLAENFYSTTNKAGDKVVYTTNNDWVSLLMSRIDANLSISAINVNNGGTTVEEIADLILALDSERDLTATQKSDYVLTDGIYSTDGNVTAEATLEHVASLGMFAPNGAVQTFESSKADASTCKSELYQTIYAYSTGAYDFMDGYKTSSTNGVNVETFEMWVHPDTMKVLTDAIEVAEALLEDVDATVDAVKDAEQDIIDAMAEVVAEAVAGTGEACAAMRDIEYYIDAAQNVIDYSEIIGVDDFGAYLAATATVVDYRDVTVSQKWVTTDEMTAMTNAIDSAQQVYDDPDSDLDTFTTTANSIKEAYDTFIATAQVGQKEAFEALDGAYTTLKDTTINGIAGAIDTDAITIANITSSTVRGADVAPTAYWASATDVEDFVNAYAIFADYQTDISDIVGASEYSEDITYHSLEDLQQQYDALEQAWGEFFNATNDGSSYTFNENSKVQFGIQGQYPTAILNAINEAQAYVYEEYFKAVDTTGLGSGFGYETTETTSATYIAVSTVNGDDIAKTDEWVDSQTQADLIDAIDTAIDDYKSITIETDGNDMALYLETIEDAIAQFEDKIANGTGKSEIAIASLEDEILKGFRIIGYTADVSEGAWTLTNTGETIVLEATDPVDKIIVASDNNGITTKLNWVTTAIFDAYYNNSETDDDIADDTGTLITAMEAYANGLDGTISAADIDTATTNLSNAITTFVGESAAGTGAATEEARAELDALLTQLTTDTTGYLADNADVKSSSVNGTNLAGTTSDDTIQWVTDEVKTALQDVYDAAKLVSDDDDSTAAQLIEAKTDLEDAIDVFEAAINTGVSVIATSTQISQLNDLITEAEAIGTPTVSTLNGADVSHNDYWAKTQAQLTAFSDALTQAKDTNRDLYTYARADEVDEAITALETANEDIFVGNKEDSSIAKVEFRTLILSAITTRNTMSGSDYTILNSQIALALTAYNMENMTCDILGYDMHKLEDEDNTTGRDNVTAKDDANDDSSARYSLIQYMANPMDAAMNGISVQTAINRANNGYSTLAPPTAAGARARTAAFNIDDMYICDVIITEEMVMGLIPVPESGSSAANNGVFEDAVVADDATDDVATDDIATDDIATDDIATDDIAGDIVNEDTPVVDDIVNEDTPVVDDIVNEDAPVVDDIVNEETPVVDDIVNEDTPAVDDIVNEDTPAVDDIVNEDTPVVDDIVNEDTPAVDDIVNEDTPVVDDIVNEDAPAVDDIVNEDTPVVEYVVEGELIEDLIVE